MPAVWTDTITHRAQKITVVPSPDTIVGIGRDVRRKESAKRRLKSRTAGKRRTARLRVRVTAGTSTGIEYVPTAICGRLIGKGATASHAGPDRHGDENAGAGA
jgi:hypothetical protein